MHHIKVKIRKNEKCAMQEQVMHGLIIGGGQKMGQSSLPTHYWMKPNKKRKSKKTEKRRDKIMTPNTFLDKAKEEKKKTEKMREKNHHSQHIIG